MCIRDSSQIEKLSEKFDFYVWKKIDSDKSAIRIITVSYTHLDVYKRQLQELVK